MPDAPATITWRLRRFHRVVGYGAAAVIDTLMVLVAINSSSGGNVAGAAIVIGISVIVLYRMQRISLTLTPTALLVRNLWQSYEIALADVYRVDASPQGIDIAYHRGTHRRVRSATAGEGLLNPWLFARRAHYGRDIAEAITARLPSAAGAAS